MTKLDNFVPKVCKHSLNRHQNNSHLVSADISKRAELMANKSDASLDLLSHWSEVLQIDVK